MFPADLVLSGSVFHIVGVVTEKARVPASVLILGRACTLELHDRTYLCCLAGVSIEIKREGCLDERAW